MTFNFLLYGKKKKGIMREKVLMNENMSIVFGV